MLKRAIPQVVLLALAAVVYLVADRFADLPPTALVFESEVVIATPDGDSVVFDGTYVFRATHPRRRSYALGFPVTQGRAGDAPAPEPPAGVAVAAEGRSLDVRVVRDGLFFDLPVEPGARTTLTVHYRMAAPGHVGTYVTRTANLWPRAIESARFVKPASVQSNYHAAGEAQAEFRQFHPKANWTVDWR